MPKASIHSPMTLEADLHRWDGKTIPMLEKIAAFSSKDPQFVRDITTLCAHPEPRVQSGATWLILNHLRSGRTIPAAAVKRWITGLKQMTSWEARLNSCQCLEHVTIPADMVPPLAAFLRSAIDGEHKFVRAWGYDGFARLAAQYPRYRKAAGRYRLAAETDEAASVRARARQIAWPD